MSQPTSKFTYTPRMSELWCNTIEYTPDWWCRPGLPSPILSTQTPCYRGRHSGECELGSGGQIIRIVGEIGEAGAHLEEASTPVTGMVEPGEHPADCAVREVLEETGIRVVATRLVWVHVTRPTVHANGDHAEYLDHVFRMDWAAGEPFLADDESVSARWFDLSTVPHMSADMRRRIELARGR
jgi:ADP-ribose pyrophosphatase YjhB (NUDIX family)